MLLGQHHESYAGLRPGEETKTEAFIDSLEYLPLTPAIARQAGLLRRDWQKKGQTSLIPT